MQELRELQEELSKLSRLSEEPGFKYFTQVLEAQTQTREEGFYLRPLKAMDEVLEQEFKKGEIAGLKLALRLVPIRIRDLQEQIEELTEELENERNDKPSGADRNPFLADGNGGSGLDDDDGL